MRALDREKAVVLMTTVARLLFANGQTTERTIGAVGQIAAKAGLATLLLVRWGELSLLIRDGDDIRRETIEIAPLGIEMHKVADTIAIVDAVGDGRLDFVTAGKALETVDRMPPVSLLRFGVLAAAGAAALGVIFGTTQWFTLATIMLSAGLGACLRRWLSHKTRNPFVQPLCAALLAGGLAALVLRLGLSTAPQLIAVCPCMILVPGPHLLSGSIDLARARIALGVARIGYAGVIILMICTGLLMGLACGGTGLPPSGNSAPVPLAYDVIAAGVAVSAFGTFFSMPWRMLPIPVAIGMAAHALRWVTIAIAGANLETAAFVACCFVGIVVTPIADRLRLPFAAFAFASVVSLIPGVFLFRMAAGLVGFTSLGVAAPAGLLSGVVADGVTATLILLAMAFGLIVPKMLIEYRWPELLNHKLGR